MSTEGIGIQALTMSDEEALSRWEDLHNHVITQTAQAFVTSFLNRCVRAHTEHTQNDLSDDVVPPLDVARILPRYRHSEKRMVFVDLEGTLWQRDLSRMAKVKVSEEGAAAELPEGVLDVLSRLADDKRNEVWLLSGLKVKGVLERIAERVPKVGIV